MSTLSESQVALLDQFGISSEDFYQYLNALKIYNQAEPLPEVEQDELNPKLLSSLSELKQECTMRIQDINDLEKKIVDKHWKYEAKDGAKDASQEAMSMKALVKEGGQLTSRWKDLENRMKETVIDKAQYIRQSLQAMKENKAVYKQRLEECDQAHAKAEAFKAIVVELNDLSQQLKPSVDTGSSNNVLLGYYLQKLERIPAKYKAHSGLLEIPLIKSEMERIRSLILNMFKLRQDQAIEVMKVQIGQVVERSDIGETILGQISDFIEKDQAIQGEQTWKHTFEKIDLAREATVMLQAQSNFDDLHFASPIISPGTPVTKPLSTYSSINKQSDYSSSRRGQLQSVHLIRKSIGRAAAALQKREGTTTQIKTPKRTTENEQREAEVEQSDGHGSIVSRLGISYTDYQAEGLKHVQQSRLKLGAQASAVSLKEERKARVVDCFELVRQASKDKKLVNFHEVMSNQLDLDVYYPIFVMSQLTEVISQDLASYHMKMFDQLAECTLEQSQVKNSKLFDFTAYCAKLISVIEVAKFILQILKPFQKAVVFDAFPTITEILLQNNAELLQNTLEQSEMYLDKLQALGGAEDPLLIEKTLGEYLRFKKTLIAFELYVQYMICDSEPPIPQASVQSSIQEGFEWNRQRASYQEGIRGSQSNPQANDDGHLQTHPTDYFEKMQAKMNKTKKIRTRATDPFALEQALSKFGEETTALLAQQGLPKFIERLQTQLRVQATQACISASEEESSVLKAKDSISTLISPLKAFISKEAIQLLELLDHQIEVLVHFHQNTYRPAQRKSEAEIVQSLVETVRDSLVRESWLSLPLVDGDLPSLAAQYQNVACLQTTLPEVIIGMLLRHSRLSKSQFLPFTPELEQKIGDLTSKKKENLLKEIVSNLEDTIQEFISDFIIPSFPFNPTKAEGGDILEYLENNYVGSQAFRFDQELSIIITNVISQLINSQLHPFFINQLVKTLLIKMTDKLLSQLVFIRDSTSIIKQYQDKIKTQFKSNLSQFQSLLRGKMQEQKEAAHHQAHEESKAGTALVEIQYSQLGVFYFLKQMEQAQTSIEEIADKMIDTQQDFYAQPQLDALLLTSAHNVHLPEHLAKVKDIDYFPRVKFVSMAILHPLKFYALFLVYCKEGNQFATSSAREGSFHVKKKGGPQTSLGTFIEQNAGVFRDLQGSHSEVFGLLMKRKEQFLAFLREFSVSPAQFQQVFQVPSTGALSNLIKKEVPRANPRLIPTPEWQVEPLRRLTADATFNVLRSSIGVLDKNEAKDLNKLLKLLPDAKEQHARGNN